MQIRLDDVVLEQMQTNETLERVGDKVVGLLSSIDRNLDNFITLWFANKMDEMEAMRERVAPAQEEPDVTPPAEKDKETKGLGFGLFGITAGIAGALTGFVTGIGETLNKLLKLFNVDLGAKLKAIGDSVKALFGPEGKIGKAIARVKAGFQSVGTFFGKIGAFFETEGALGKIMTRIQSFFQPIVNFAKGFGATFAKFFGFFRIIGRVFLPLTAIFEVGKALFEEFTSLVPGSDFFDNIMALFKGIVKGVANIVLVPVDMIKDGLAWLLDKMGATSIADAMKGFSFVDSFGMIVDRVYNFLEAIARGAVAALGAVLPGGETPQGAFMKEFNHVMSGGAGGAPPEPETGQAPAGEDGAQRPMTRFERKQAASRRRETLAANPGRAVDKYGNLIPIEGDSPQSSDGLARVEGSSDGRSIPGGTDRLSGDSSRSVMGDVLGQESMNAQTPPVVMVNNTSNVNAPSSTVNQDLVSDLTPIPTMSNGSRADAYSAA